MLNKLGHGRLNPINLLTILLKEERRSSAILLLAALLSLIATNTVLLDTYSSLFLREYHFLSLHLDIRHIINEGLMAMFFLVIGLEVKRELIDGELRTLRKAAFPLIAAIGGMLLPALIYTLFNPSPPASSGWGIPMATDIAIAAGALALVGRRLPRSLRVFLLSLAIIDDVGTILVISIFYSRPDNMFALLFASLLVVALLFIRRENWWPIGFLIFGLIIWYCLERAGVSATLTGVVIAALMPLSTRRKNAVKLQTAEKIEKVLIPLTSYIVVPAFVFANAGIELSSLNNINSESLPVFIGVFFGLLIGKPLGILIASLIAHYSGVAEKSESISWSHISGIGFIAGIGFTVSLFISNLAFGGERGVMFDASRFGIFSASILAAIIGIWILRRTKQIDT